MIFITQRKDSKNAKNPNLFTWGSFVSKQNRIHFLSEKVHLYLLVFLCSALSCNLFAETSEQISTKPKAESAMIVSSLDMSVLEQLPIQERGRIKPFSTFARETMLSLYGRTRFSRPNDSKKWSDMEVMAALWLQPRDWEKEALILVDYQPLRKQLGLDLSKKHFSYQTLVQNEKLREMISEIRQLRAKNSNAPLNRLQDAARQVNSRLQLFETLILGNIFNFVPHPREPHGPWIPVSSCRSYYSAEESNAIESAFQSLLESFRGGDKTSFLSASQQLHDCLKSLHSPAFPSASQIALEHLYVRSHPFRWSALFYGLTALIMGFSWTWRRGYSLAWGVLIVGFVLQVIGFVFRILISGRPPVTNMYESVIWVSFGIMLFAIIFESIYRSRYLILAGAPIAVISLILADTQPTILDGSIHPLVPVLRSNFWLTIHVLTITLSYAAFALALGLGHIILGKTIFKRETSSPLIEHYLYRALQIGVLLLAAGTILGGVWANYSWGRFWGWDPKETWALTALLCYLFVLHGRIAGWWKGYGLAVGSILCFQSVLMAWYGVNFVLGKGLHSYGFGSGGFPFVAIFVALEILFTISALWKRQTIELEIRN